MSSLPLLLLTVSALLALAAGIFGFSIRWSELIVIHYGYFFIFIAFGCFVYSLYKVSREYFGRIKFTDKSLLPVLVVAGCSIVLLLHEPFGFKVVMDEPLLLSTSRMMHYENQVLTPYEANSYEGSFKVTKGYLDKRPYFHPFLISLLHTLTGYRPENTFLLNILLTPILLILAYFFGKKLTGRRGGIVAVLLLTSIPLLAQNATGGHFEILNLVMILGVMQLACLYLERPGPERLAALCFGGILLTQTRYESTLFALPVALVVLLGWIKKKEIIMPWPVVFSPLLLICYPMHFRVTLSRDDFAQIGDLGNEQAFSWSYFWNNLDEAGKFLFNFGQGLSNSLLVSLAGVMALGFFAGYLIIQFHEIREKEPANIVLTLFLGTVMLCFGLVMCYHWGQLSDPVASRFGLPLLLMFVLTTTVTITRWPRPFLLSILVLFGVVLWFYLLKIEPLTLLTTGIKLILLFIAITAGTLFVLAKRLDAENYFIGIILLMIIFVSVPVTASHRYAQSYTPALEVRMILQFFKDHPQKDYLLVSRSPLLSISYGIAAVGVPRVLKSPVTIHKHLLHRTYSSIYLFQLADVNDETGEITVLEDYDIGPDFELELVTEQRLVPLQLARIMRIVGVHLPETENSAEPESPAPSQSNIPQLYPPAIAHILN